MNDNSIDFKSYLECKPLLSFKDEIIAKKICEEFKKKNGTKEVYILDVGSGEASLLEKICNNLSNNGNFWKQKQIIIEAVEPSKEGQEYIKEVKKRLEAKGILINLYEEKIESYLEQNKKKFDFILSIHSLYFIEVIHWKELLNRLIGVLNSEGEFLIELVSKKSEIYELGEIINLEKVSAPKRYDSCGWYYFAEDLENILKKIQIKYDSIKLKSTIYFNNDIIEQDKLFFRNSRMIESKLVKFLSFMYRIYPEDLMRIGKDLINEILSKEQVQFNSFDYLFIIRK